MSRYLIELYDLNLNERSIIEQHDISSNESIHYFKKILDRLKNMTGLYDLQLKISEDNLNADIYIVKDEIEVGWIYNFKKTSENILYKLSLIKLQNNYFKNIDKNYNYGYAKECFSPEWKKIFLDELHHKLSLPNYGLE